MKTGRPPKPTLLHKLHGTDRPYVRRRAQTEPQPVGDLKDPPEWFDEGQREAWDYAIIHAPAGLMKMLDRGMLALWCEAEDRHRRATIAQAELNRRSRQLPYLIRDKNKELVPSPYVEILDRTARIMFQASDRLGFSPVARPRIKLDEPPATSGDATNPWALLKLIPGGKPD
jgi:phage terminase small subunit